MIADLHGVVAIVKELHAVLLSANKGVVTSVVLHVSLGVFPPWGGGSFALRSSLVRPKYLQAAIFVRLCNSVTSFSHALMSLRARHLPKSGNLMLLVPLLPLQLVDLVVEITGLMINQTSYTNTCMSTDQG